VSKSTEMPSKIPDDDTTTNRSRYNATLGTDDYDHRHELASKPFLEWDDQSS
jgi:hypothetical protein